MDRDLRSQLAHAGHPIAAPLGDESVDRLLAWAASDAPARALDLGCGGGEWLVRLLQRTPALSAVGVDSSRVAIDQARARARELGVADRLTLHCGDANGLATDEGFDLVLSVGATHAFGGFAKTLAAIGSHLSAGGCALVGDGFWERPPSSMAVETLGRLADLPALIATATTAGWTPAYGHISTRFELDDYEWSWTGSLVDWAMRHPTDPDAESVLATAAEHRREWLQGYRDSFGFVCLGLRRSL
jgi:SAM-dependent methyltransferase